MRYDEVYSRRARRAVQEGGIDITTFMEDMVAGGISPERLEELLLQDLEEGGPVFGKFLRSLSGAAESAVMAAERQGDMVGYASEEKAYQELLGLSKMEDALDDADPELLETMEAAVNDEFTWIATLENTCHLCLPLHGTSRTMEEWRTMGKHPDTIHPGSWRSSCHCQLVPTRQAAGRADLVAPLVRERVKSSTGLKGVKKTQRRVAQRDPTKAQRAVAEAMKTKEGRRTLRLMGRYKQQTQGVDNGES